MSAISESAQSRFIADRMLGTLTRYLRFMGYDTLSANSLRSGNAAEDTILLRLAHEEDRILLTRDRELARRGGAHAVLLTSEDPVSQIEQLSALRLIHPELVMSRCSICNTLLRPAAAEEIRGASYAPSDRTDLEFSWCEVCGRLYWMGSHGRSLRRRLRCG
jgi:uncharacterized protein with PIN domain